jgi:hypothetical protein
MADADLFNTGFKNRVNGGFNSRATADSTANQVPHPHGKNGGIGMTCWFYWWANLVFVCRWICLAGAEAAIDGTGVGN